MLFMNVESFPALSDKITVLPGQPHVLVGAFSENGPFRPSGKVLVRNEHSWNKEANMLYLETPVGVGFSFSIQTSFETVDDKITGMSHHFEQLLIDIHQTKLFITGESYAGHYIPQLAELMIQLNKKKMLFNLKGIALGNPVLEFETDFNSRAEYF
ncbi:hypothetical protein IFM89_000530 [Coptis chinensis]|uniref:Carboxypeptidase n=1 Tax=Coptis chinensis TaxID=261450 RepID=A0A835H2G3_9MAGN|nr:hypothetical protein IFM89_000530 [Coptis chinensis]